MKKMSPIEVTARRVVSLLSDRKPESIRSAVDVLEKFFLNQPDLISRAYELAWLVALKKNIFLNTKEILPKPSPDADILAVEASDFARRGKLPQAFSLLRSANNSGASRNLCRNVVFEILRRLERRDRVIHLSYGTKFGIPSMTTLELGRIPGSGLMVVRNPGSKYDLKSKSWKPEEGRAAIDAGLILLKNDEEIKNEVEQGIISYLKVGKALDSFDRIDWTEYLKIMNEEKNLSLAA